MIVTDGGFRADGTFLPRPAHDTAALTEAFRRAVLRLFVRRGIFEADDAEGMLAWPPSGFHVPDGVWVADGDLDFAKRLARYCARHPVALDRLQYDGPATSVQHRSDKRDGPTAGTETVDPLEFLARLVTHIPKSPSPVKLPAESLDCGEAPPSQSPPGLLILWCRKEQDHDPRRHRAAGARPCRSACALAPMAAAGLRLSP